MSGCSLAIAIAPGGPGTRTEDVPECSVQIKAGVIQFGSTLMTEFSGTGPVKVFECQLDGKTIRSECEFIENQSSAD